MPNLAIDPVCGMKVNPETAADRVERIPQVVAPGGDGHAGGTQGAHRGDAAGHRRLVRLPR